MRRFFGSTVALAAYALLLASPLFYDAYVTDYPDGSVITFLFGGVYFGVTVEGARRPLLRAGLSGFFLAAAAGTNLFACVVIAFLLLVYLAVRGRSVPALRACWRDAAAGAVGALALLIVCGTFSKANGGGFLFFMPSLRAVGSIDLRDYKAHGYAWLASSPQLLLPLFVTAAVAVVYLFAGREWRRDVSYRFALGAAAALGGYYALLVVWEFAFTGDFLETQYYVSLFNVAFLLCAAAILAEFWRHLEARGVGAVRFVAVVAVAAALPTLITYGVSLAPIGRLAGVTTLVLMGVFLVLFAGLRGAGGVRFGAVGVAALAAAFSFTCNYAGAGATQTAQAFVRGSYTENSHVLSVAMQLIDFMRANGLQNGAPAFWYNPGEDENLNGIQSTYLWGITWVGLDMPKIDDGMRGLLNARRPEHIVLLCKNHGCRGGPAALQAAGYKPSQVAEGLLTSGPERVWVRAFELPRYIDRLTPAQHWYIPGQASFVQVLPAGGRTWSFASGIPDGWTGTSEDAARAAAGGSFTTLDHQWNYELVSPDMTLPPGSYTLYLRGKVLAGGLDLGVLDTGSNKWIEQRMYWYAQKRFDTAWMATPFGLTQETKVRFILSNWVPKAASSRWQLRELRLVRTG